MHFLEIEITEEQTFDYGCETNKKKKNIVSAFTLIGDGEKYEVKYVLGSKTYAPIREALNVYGGHAPLYIFEKDNVKTIVSANKTIRKDNLAGLTLTEWSQYTGDEEFLKKYTV
jgi:hypothetical protein